MASVSNRPLEGNVCTFFSSQILIVFNKLYQKLVFCVSTKAI